MLHTVLTGDAGDFQSAIKLCFHLSSNHALPKLNVLLGAPGRTPRAALGLQFATKLSSANLDIPSSCAPGRTPRAAG